MIAQDKPVSRHLKVSRRLNSTKTASSLSLRARPICLSNVVLPGGTIGKTKSKFARSSGRGPGPGLPRVQRQPAPKVVASTALPKSGRHRPDSASKPCMTVSKSHGSSTTWRLSHAPLKTFNLFGRLDVVAVSMEQL